MKISKKIEPIIIGLSSSLIIGVLAFLSLETSTGFWLMISFGATSLITFVLYDKEFAFSFCIQCDSIRIVTAAANDNVFLIAHG